MTDATAAPNAEQRVYWSDVTGPRWVAQQAELDAQLASLGREALDRAEIALGARVLDVGCGCGQTLLDLGERVGPAGRVLGVDISSVMLARAEQRVRDRGMDHVAVLHADAQTHAFEPGAFAHVFSRFGVMFFADPVAAFANLRRALAAGGRLTFICWQSLAANPWMALPMRAAAAHVTLPPPSAPDAPGPFSFADPERVRGILQAAGFSQIEPTSLAHELPLGDDAAAATRRCLQMGPASAALRMATERGEKVDVDALHAAIEAALAPFARADGVRMPSASWLVEARA
jgi:SAM-dependent methyltransferase